MTQTPTVNRQILLASRPEGEATVDNFLNLAATYGLSTRNEWEEAPGATLLELC